MLPNQDKQLIAQILSSPEAAIIVEEVNAVLEEEKRKREAFYNEITEYEKAEFINGHIVIHSPVKKEHNDVNGALYRLISTYVKQHQLGYVGFEKVMISLTRNDYEPDICFFSMEKAKSFKKGQSLFPAPDLIVEVLSPKTAANDRGIKFQDYQAHEVLEYLLIDPQKEIVEHYRLNEQGEYELVLKAGEGTFHSQAINGFNIQIQSIFDDGKNLEELRKILHN